MEGGGDRTEKEPEVRQAKPWHYREEFELGSNLYWGMVWC